MTIELTQIQRRELTAIVRTACVQIRIELDTPGLGQRQYNHMMGLWYTHSTILDKLTAADIGTAGKKPTRRNPIAIVPGIRKTPRPSRTR